MRYWADRRGRSKPLPDGRAFVQRGDGGLVAVVAAEAVGVRVAQVVEDG